MKSVSKMILNKQKKIIIGVIGHDIHCVAIKLLEMELENNDYCVLNLGVDTEPELFKDAAIEFGADAVLISSLNGEWKHWIPQFSNISKDINEKPIYYLGGNIFSSSKFQKNQELKLIKTCGFKKVFDKNHDFKKVTKQLKKDLL